MLLDFPREIINYNFIIIHYYISGVCKEHRKVDYRNNVASSRSQNGGETNRPTTNLLQKQLRSIQSVLFMYINSPIYSSSLKNIKYL